MKKHAAGIMAHLGALAIAAGLSDRKSDAHEGVHSPSEKSLRSVADSAERLLRAKEKREKKAARRKLWGKL